MSEIRGFSGRLAILRDGDFNPVVKNLNVHICALVKIVTVANSIYDSFPEFYVQNIGDLFTLQFLNLIHVYVLLE
ncbi:hypothetical protein [Methanosarcina barkeri]|nr:hypothetical protein [Methanosarcina barkeri]